MATPESVDTLLDTIEKTLIKVQDALPDGKAPSAVKLQRGEHDLLSFIEKARDTMMGCVQDKSDRDRKKMTELFGGDCVRISRMRAYLEATKLSEKHSADQRLPMCISTCDIVERVLTEKGLGQRLQEANKRFIPWAPRPQGAGGHEAAPPSAPAPAPA